MSMVVSQECLDCLMEDVYEAIDGQCAVSLSPVVLRRLIFELSMGRARERNHVMNEESLERIVRRRMAKAD